MYKITDLETSCWVIPCYFYTHWNLVIDADQTGGYGEYVEFVGFLGTEVSFEGYFYL